ncbi:MAG: DUF6691 family protein [Myxococcota bacterium]
MKVLTALLAGLLFGAGLCLSGMTWPSKVVGFLDIAGAWDPSLAFVMAGAVGTYAASAFFIRRRGAPLLADAFEPTPAAKLDPRLLSGAAIFGVGWGLSGYCPGPAFVSIAALAPATLVFIVALVAGMIVAKRARSSLAAALAVMCLNPFACTDDVRTGVFVDGPVIGLHYQTLTRQGLTNAKGEFEYAGGETVTFTVGGVVLGTLAGKDRISPFDLFGIAPPTDAAELRELLRDDVVTDFDRAANVALFLQALDADRDPANGIDVTSWGATLAGVPFAFDEGFGAFAFGSFQRFAAAHPGIDRNIDVAAVLPHLYATLGLSVPAHVAATYAADYGNDGAADVTSTLTVDELGRVIRVRSDVDANGLVDRDDTTTYDARGRVISAEYRRDGAQDGVFERVESYTYVFDSDGYASSLIVQDTTNGIIGLKQSFTYTYDTAGNLLTTLQENDDGGNGSVESRRSETSTYDLAGRRVTSRIETDINGDGVTNSIVTDSRTWNAGGFLTQAVTETDSNADGVVNSRETVTYALDEAGHVLMQATEVRSGDAVIALAHTNFTYDANGNSLGHVYEEDSDADGTIDYRSAETRSYLDDGRPLNQTLTIDNDADDAPDFISTTTRVHDEQLNLLSEVVEDDDGGDGTVDSRRTSDRTYDAFGNQLTRLSRADTDNDGIIDSQTLETTTYSEIADGLYQLVFELVVD